MSWPERARRWSGSPGASPSMSWSFWTRPAETDFRLRCLCSKGTYIRTLCHDLGQAPGLRRGHVLPCAAPWRRASRWRTPSRWRTSSRRESPCCCPPTRLFADSPALTRCPLPAGKSASATGIPSRTRPSGRHLPGLRPKRRFSLPLPGTGRHSHRHQEFLWRVTYVHQRKKSLPWASLTESIWAMPPCCGGRWRRPPAGA